MHCLITKIKKNVKSNVFDIFQIDRKVTNEVIK